MTDAYDTLGLEPVFALERTTLDKRHLELSRALHPDRFVGALPAERRRALSDAIAVNEAHRALRDPVRRAELLLSRLGLAEPKGSTSQSFLFEMMELREELSSYVAARDESALSKLVRRASDRRGAALEHLAALFTAAQAIPESERTQCAEVSELFVSLAELRYLQRLVDEATSQLDEMQLA